MPQAQYQFLLDLANTKFENDLIARGLAAQDQPSTYDITDRVMEASVRRGRDNELDPFGPGSMTLLLDNTDWRFTPDYGASPLYGKLRPGAMVTARAPVPDYTGLVSWWTLDEAAASTRYDSYGTNHLSMGTAGTVGRTDGHVGGAARVGYLDWLKVASNSTLQAGDTDFSVACWVKLEDSFTSGYIASKFNDSAGGNEWVLWYGSNLFKFTVYTTGGAATTVTASTFGAPSAGVWYFVMAFHDSVNNVIGISVNNGTIDITSYSAGVAAGSAAFVVGAYDGGAVTSDKFSVDNVSFWKRILKPYDAPSSLLTGLVSYWKLDEASGTRYDSVTASANDLTDNNTVTQAAGVNGTDKAAQFTAANTESLSHVDTASLQLTGSMTWALWVYADNLSSDKSILTKASAWASGTIEYQLTYSSSLSRFQFYLGGTGGTPNATPAVAYSIATWYFFSVTYNRSTQTLKMRVNNANEATNAAAGIPNVVATPLRLGVGLLNNFGGRMARFGMWNRVLTDPELAALYGSGTPPDYPFVGVP